MKKAISNCIAMVDKLILSFYWELAKSAGLMPNCFWKHFEK